MSVKVLEKNKTENMLMYKFSSNSLFFEYQNSVALKRIIDTGDYIYLDGFLCLKSTDCLFMNYELNRIEFDITCDYKKYCVARIIDSSRNKGGRRTRERYRPMKGYLKRRYDRRTRVRRTEYPRTLMDMVYTDLTFGCLSTAVYRNLNFTYLHAQNHSLLDNNRNEFRRYLSGKDEPPEDSFGKCVKFYLRKKKITQKTLSQRLNVATDTVSRICCDKYEPPINMAVAICIALHLYPFESRNLLRKLGYSLEGNTKTNRTYQVLIDVFYMESVANCNSFLIEEGLKPLTSQKDWQ